MLISTVPPILKLLAFVHFISIKYENLFGKEYQSYESLREMDKKDQEWPKASNPALETSWIKTEKKKKRFFCSHEVHPLSYSQQPDICALDPTPWRLFRDRFSPILSSPLNQPNQPTDVALLPCLTAKWNTTETFSRYFIFLLFFIELFIIYWLKFFIGEELFTLTDFNFSPFTPFKPNPKGICAYTLVRSLCHFLALISSDFPEVFDTVDLFPSSEILFTWFLGPQKPLVLLFFCFFFKTTLFSLLCWLFLFCLTSKRWRIPGLRH